MFYLKTHAVHILQLYGIKEGSVLFNNAVNTFSYGYMTSDIE